MEIITSKELGYHNGHIYSICHKYEWVGNERDSELLKKYIIPTSYYCFYPGGRLKQEIIYMKGRPVINLKFNKLGDIQYKKGTDFSYPRLASKKVEKITVNSELVKITQTYYQGNWLFITDITHYSNNQITKTERIFCDGSKWETIYANNISIESHFYTARGTHSHKVIDKDCEYEYDAIGNWIKRIPSVTKRNHANLVNKEYIIHYRHIKYYKP